MIWVALFACFSGDPALDQERRALDAWRQGVTALEDREYEKAQQRFAEARPLSKEDPLVIAWEAKALADQGQLEKAVEVLEQALKVQPDFPEARYNRAAYLCRLQRPEDAAAELQIAFEQGVSVTPRQTLLDPDFAAWQGHEAFEGVLPSESLSVAVEGPEGSVFWGSEFRLRLRVLGAGDSVLEVHAPQTQGGAQLLAVDELEVASSEGLFRDLTYRFRVLEPGNWVMGPFSVTAGRRQTEGPEVVVTAKAPPDRAVTQSAPWVWRTPRELLLDPNAEWARREGGNVLVTSNPGDRVDVIPAMEPTRYSWKRKDGQERFVWVYSMPTPAKVTLRRPGEPALETEL